MELLYFLGGLLVGGFFSWFFTFLYYRKQAAELIELRSVLARVDSRGRAEFIEKRDTRAKAVQRENGNYGVNYGMTLGGKVNISESIEIEKETEREIPEENV